MRFYLKRRNDVNWIEITEYVSLPAVITDTVDGTYSSVDLTCYIPTGISGLDAKKPIPPKWELKIVDGDIEQELVNTFYFITTDQSNVSVRKETIMEGGVATEGLYKHRIRGYEPLYRLEGKYAPNYTITQPKTEFFDAYVKSGVSNFVMDYVFEQDGNGKTLPQGVKVDLAGQNNFGAEQVIFINYDNVKNKHYIELHDIDSKSFDVGLLLTFRKTASSHFKYRRVWERTLNVEVGEEPAGQGHHNRKSNSKFEIKYEIEYLDSNNNVVASDTKENLVKYSGGLTTGAFPFLGLPEINSFPNTPAVFSDSVIVNKNFSANKARVYISLSETNEEFNIFRDGNYYSTLNAKFNYGGVSYNTDKVLTNIMELTLRATSSQYDNPLVDKKITLYEFLEKAIFDYNFNTRDKITIADNVRLLLDTPAKESEWVDYNYKEIVERVFNYVGVRPYLTYDNVLTYREERFVPHYVDLEQQSDKQGEQLGDDFFDVVLNKSKNLVSDKDFITEYLPITSSSAEFTKVDDSDISFLANNDIYYITKAILYTPNLSFNLGKDSGNNNIIVKSNMGEDYYWDITSRVFEKDIYDSFPNVRLDIDKSFVLSGFLWGITRARPDLYSKTNTIYYKSGSGLISGLGHLGEPIPNFNWLDGLIGAGANYLNGEYAIVELLLTLAYKWLADEGSYGDATMNNVNPDISLETIAGATIGNGWELEITYAPIYKELTTKHTSNMGDRKGIYFEKKFNMTDRVVSYDESGDILRVEMESKGNVKNLYNEKVRNLADTIQANSIVNDNQYITTRIMTLHNNLVSVDYILQKNFVLKNDDIRLPVEFDRYNVPYEYVKREIYIDNHIIFDNHPMNFTLGEMGMTVDLIKKTITAYPDTKELEKPMYANFNFIKTVGDNDFKVLTRIGKLETKFTMILTGGFLDNYSAGNQRYYYDNLVYTQPFRYTNEFGKIKEIKGLSAGWHETTTSNIRLLQSGGNYDINKFPQGDIALDFTNKLFEFDTPIALIKDPREAISFTHTSFLESYKQDVKFYSFKAINGIGVLKYDIEFSDDLTIDDIEFYDFGNAFSYITVVENDNDSYIEFKSTHVFNDNHLGGIVLYNITDNNYTLVGLIKNPNFTDFDIFRVYFSSTRYGHRLDNMIYYESENRVDVFGRTEFKLKKIKKWNTNGNTTISGNLETTHKKAVKKDTNFNATTNVFGNVLYELQKYEYGFQGISGSTSVNGNIFIAQGKGIYGSYLTNGETNVSGLLGYEIGLAIHKGYTTYGESSVLGNVSYELIKTEGRKYSFAGEIGIDSYITDNHQRKILKTDNFSGSASISGELNYDYQKMILKTDNFSGDTEITANIETLHKKHDFVAYNSVSTVAITSDNYYIDGDGLYIGIAPNGETIIQGNFGIDLKKRVLKQYNSTSVVGVSGTKVDNHQKSDSVLLGFDGDVGVDILYQEKLGKGKKVSLGYMGEANVDGVLDFNLAKSIMPLSTSGDVSLDILHQVYHGKGDKRQATYNGNSSVVGTLSYVKKAYKFMAYNDVATIATSGSYARNHTKGSYKYGAFNQNVAVNGNLSYNINRHKKLSVGFIGEVYLEGTKSDKHTKTIPPMRWSYNGRSSLTTCYNPPFNMLGTTCSTENEIIAVSNSSIGFGSSGCAELKCVKI